MPAAVQQLRSWVSASFSSLVHCFLNLKPSTDFRRLQLVLPYIIRLKRQGTMDIVLHWWAVLCNQALLSSFLVLFFYPLQFLLLFLYFKSRHYLACKPHATWWDPPSVANSTTVPHQPPTLSTTMGNCTYKSITIPLFKAIFDSPHLLWRGDDFPPASRAV